MRLFGLDIKKSRSDVKKDTETNDYLKIMKRENQRLQLEIEAERQKMMLEDLRDQLREQREENRAMYSSDDEEGGGGSEEALLMQILAPLLQKQLSVPGNPPATTTPTLRSYSDEELRGILERIPRDTLKIARSYPDDVLKGEIKARALGDADEDTLIRAVKLIKT
jgi:hypothetical protein